MPKPQPIISQSVLPVMAAMLTLLMLQIEMMGQVVPLEIYQAVPDLETDINTASELHGPQKCTLLGDSLLVIDPYANKVVIFDARTGAELGAFGRAGRGPGEFDFPIDIKVDEASGSIWVLDQTRIIQFDRHGSYLHSFSKSVNSWTMGLLPGNELALAAPANERRAAISILSPDGELIREFGDSYPFLTTGEAQARYGDSYVEYAFGRVWQVGIRFNLLREYSLNGNLIHESQIGLPSLTEVHSRNIRFANPPRIPGSNPKILVYSISSSTDALWIVTAGQFTKGGRGLGLENMHVYRINPVDRSQIVYRYDSGTLVDIAVLQENNPAMLIGIDASLQQIVWLRPALVEIDEDTGSIGPSERHE